MFNIIIGIILLVAAVFLVAAVLLQSSKSHKLPGTIAGGAETFFGKTKGTTIDRILSKATSVVAIIFCVLVVVMYVAQGGHAGHDHANDDTTPSSDSVTVDENGDDTTEPTNDTTDEAAGDENAADDNVADENVGGEDVADENTGDENAADENVEGDTASDDTSDQADAE